jgi:hypothetical protein
MTNFNYICIYCNKYVKTDDQPTAQKFLTKHNKTGWTGARKTRICVTDLVTNEYLEKQLGFNERRHKNDQLTQEVL